MAQEFDPGETVQLKSGGPLMTIVERGRFAMDTAEGYRCRWFDDKHKLNENVFADAELKRARYGETVADACRDIR